MDADRELEFEFPGSFRVFKSGLVERLEGTNPTPPGINPTTGVASKDVAINDAVTARLYLPNLATENAAKKLPVVVFFHGGAFAVHTAASPEYHAFVDRVAAEAKAVAVSVTYRLVPEHCLPAAYDDAWAAYNWVLAQCRGDGDIQPEQWLAERGDARRIFLAGDSAGGNMAYYVAARIGREGMTRVKGIALLHCYFWGKDAIGGESRDAGFRRWMEANWLYFCAGKYGMDHPYVNFFSTPEGEAARLGCERALLTTAEHDFFVHRCRAFVDWVKASGWTGEVELHETEGKAHCFFLGSPETDEAAAHMAAVAAFIKKD